jgi:hypothetical protein
MMTDGNKKNEVIKMVSKDDLKKEISLLDMKKKEIELLETCFDFLKLKLELIDLNTRRANNKSYWIACIMYAIGVGLSNSLPFKLFFLAMSLICFYIYFSTEARYSREAKSILDDV